MKNKKERHRFLRVTILLNFRAYPIATITHTKEKKRLLRNTKTETFLLDTYFLK